MGDKGYSSPTVRHYLHHHGIRVTIPRRKDQRPDICFNPAVYKERNKIERLVGRLEQFQRIATRSDKRAINYKGWLTLAAILIWLPTP